MRSAPPDGSPLLLWREEVKVRTGHCGGREERTGARRLTEEEGALCLMEGPFVGAAHHGNGANRGAKLM